MIGIKVAILFVVNPRILHHHDTAHPSYINYCLERRHFITGYFLPVTPCSTNEQWFKKNFCNQSSHYENYEQFLLQIEAIMCLQ